MRFQILPGLVLFLAASPALAAQQPDLEVTITPPTPTPYVYADARYDVKVRNIGNKNAAGVILTIQLPKTGTSPQVYIMGTPGAKDGRCSFGTPAGSAAATRLTCNLGTINKNGAFTIPYFNASFPEKTGDLLITATATTTTLPVDPNPANNTNIPETADLNYQAVTATGNAHIRHCTGTALTAFFECTKFPSSITAHDHTFNADGTLSIVPGYGGTWSQTGTDLEFKYYLSDNCSGTTCSGTPEVEFVGRGAINTTPNCFEGLARFPTGPTTYSTYVSPYEVCLTP